MIPPSCRYYLLIRDDLQILAVPAETVIRFFKTGTLIVELELADQKVKFFSIFFYFIQLVATFSVEISLPKAKICGRPAKAIYGCLCTSL